METSYILSWNRRHCQTLQHCVAVRGTYTLHCASWYTSVEIGDTVKQCNTVLLSRVYTHYTVCIHVSWNRRHCQTLQHCVAVRGTRTWHCAWWYTSVEIGDTIKHCNTVLQSCVYTHYTVYIHASWNGRHCQTLQHCLYTHYTVHLNTRQLETKIPKVYMLHCAYTHQLK